MDTNKITGSIFCPLGSMRTVFPRINWRARTATIITGISIYTRSLISILSYQKSLNIGNFYRTSIKNKPRPPKNTASTVRIIFKDTSREWIIRMLIWQMLLSWISYNYWKLDKNTHCYHKYTILIPFMQLKLQYLINGRIPKWSPYGRKMDD